MMRQHNHIGTMRNIADLILNSSQQLDDYYINNWLPRDTADEHTKAMTKYDEWYERESRSRDRANEAHKIIWGLVSTAELLAAEKGMKTGARLVMELLGVNE